MANSELTTPMEYFKASQAGHYFNRFMELAHMQPDSVAAQRIVGANMIDGMLEELGESPEASSTPWPTTP